ncbi:MAG TPA: tail fiber protein [Pyrinomonadaceae bacterium]|nr:tail fiber protein [Pyrinomonadaceae bacterium]
MASPFIAEIRMFAGTFAPRFYAFCDGQIIAISQNTALFSLIGTFYGGNGQTTFGLPNLQGRAPIHTGQGPGLTDRVIGETGGSENVTLLSTQIPQHNHSANALNAAGNQTSPANNTWATVLSGRNAQLLYGTSANTQMNPNAVGISGGSQPHNNLPPYLVVSFIIALQGIFPSRN